MPVPLGPVVLSDPYELTASRTLSELPHSIATRGRDHERSESKQHFLQHATTKSYLESRETPYQRCARRSEETLMMRSNASYQNLSSTPMDSNKSSKGTPSTLSLSGSLMHHAREASNSSAHSTISERPRAGSRLQRKRSNQSQKSYGHSGDSDVEKEVLELNTIVEERRAEGNKGRSRNSHVPAVAPAMQVNARSETLNDIGSALSRPLTAHKAYRSNSRQGTFSPGSDKMSLRSQPSNASSQVPGSPSGVTSSAGHIAPSTIRLVTSNDEQFCRISARSPSLTDRALSASSSLTTLDSPSYTLETSPAVSKRYSRSLMITPLPEFAADEGIGRHDCVTREVGVAL